ncbi:MAG: hypothetical protein WCD69_12350, partial [Xanthobacteraceae bacterium]
MELRKRAELSEKPVQSSGGFLVNVAVHYETLKILGEISVAIQLLLPNPNDSLGRLTERVGLDIRRELLLELTTVIVGNPGLIHDKKQQAMMQVENFGTCITHMNRLNGLHVSLPGKSDTAARD